MSGNDNKSNVPKEWLLPFNSTSKSSEQIGSSSWDGSCEPSPQVSLAESCSFEGSTRDHKLETIGELTSSAEGALPPPSSITAKKSPAEANPWAISPDASLDQDDSQISLKSFGSFPKSTTSVSDTKQETNASTTTSVSEANQETDASTTSVSDTKQETNATAHPAVTTCAPSPEEPVAPTEAPTSTVETTVVVVPASSTEQPTMTQEAVAPAPSATDSAEPSNNHVKAMIDAANAFMTQTADSMKTEEDRKISRFSSERTEDIRISRFSSEPSEKLKVEVSEDEEEQQVGGPLWLAAVRSVEDRPLSPGAPGTTYALQIDATCETSEFDTEDEEAYIFTANLARKRVRAVQLLAFGVVGFVLGFCGSVLVMSSCHFVTAATHVGDGYDVGNVFDLHYGLWKYSPLDSAFNNYAYCTSYDEKHTSYTPWISRIGGSVALALATYSLSVLWIYLFRGSATYATWKAAVIFLVVAGLGQASTLWVLLDDVCSLSEGCRLSAIGYLSGIISLFWFILAAEMQVNMPVSFYVDTVTGTGENIVGGLDAEDLKESAKSYITRPMKDSYKTGGTRLPSLNELRRKKRSTPSVASMSRKSSAKGSYKSPSFNIV
mmetsp:Transcript_18314/g.25821  ORF Transcript_18314/g.25821 Transcript_18314/m.25821 type:complete len:607 (-) Transcript_18314:778-2598(-)